MSEFNVRENSPIKMPEQKCCPACGQKIASDVKQLENVMSHYIEPVTGAVSVVNGKKDVLEFPTQDKKSTYKVYRVTGRDSNGKAFSEFAPKDAKSEAPAPKSTEFRTPVIAPTITAASAPVGQAPATK